MSKTIPMLPSLYANGGGIPDHDLTEDDLLWTVDGNTLNTNRDRKTRVSELRAHLFGTQYRTSAVAVGPKPPNATWSSPYIAENINLVKGAPYKLTLCFRHSNAVLLQARVRVGAGSQYEFNASHAHPQSANVSAWSSSPWAWYLAEKHTVMTNVFIPNIGAAWADGTGDDPAIQVIMDITTAIQYTGQTDWYFYGAHMLFERIG